MTDGSDLARFLNSAPWSNLTFNAPKPAHDAKGMLTWFERIMLAWLTSELYDGKGEIVELGVFLGSSTISLASGLELNKKVPADNLLKRIHAYDRFIGHYEANWVRKNTTFEIGKDNNFLSVYRENIKNYEKYVEINVGDLCEKTWRGGDIEILFVDVLKSPELADKVINDFFPSMMPGKTVLVMQDYIFQELPYTVIVMEHFAEYFERAGDTWRNSVLYVNTKPIPPAMMASFKYHRLPEALRLHYLMQALTKQRTFAQRECVAHLISDFVTNKFR
ncbi:class I SAM-dependent methyltransferase [Hansschlegelia sp. KR7-227]|uniref:class I SAM-dependent methyltransferase n=1 Tax=Hansschlegelia sp. KR7-227 TaxID=3400914 RepID=UPI003C0235DD